MKAKFYFMAFMLMSCIGAFAQWTKPVPTGTTLAAGEECYLYNVKADAFFLGANDWLTRASVSELRGYKVWLEAHESDPSSYYITNYIEDGDHAGETLCVYIADWDAVWIDQAKDGDNDKLFTFEDKGDGTYKIGLSALNKSFVPTVWVDAYLGLIPAKEDTRLYICDAEGEFDVSTFQTTWKIVSPTEYATYIPAKKTWNAANKLGTPLQRQRLRTKALT